MTACGPVTREQAERSCIRDAELAAQPRGTVGLGVVSGPGGTRTAAGISFEVSGDYIMGRDPEEVYRSCVYRRSGQLPSVPLSAQQ